MVGHGSAIESKYLVSIYQDPNGALGIVESQRNILNVLSLTDSSSIWNGIGLDLKKRDTSKKKKKKSI